MSSGDLFSGKAAEYGRYRVDYPEAVIEVAFQSVGLGRSDVVADLGSGTGMLSRWILGLGNRVFGVEPDPGMRSVAEQSLSGFGGRFASIEGTAERTSLADASVTLVTAGNAFHYFDPRPARAEVERILQPGGRVLLIGHEAVSTPNPFMRAYLDFIASIAPRETWTFHERDRMPQSLVAFFGGDTFQQRDSGDMAFDLTWEELRGRFLSTSVAPPAGDTRRTEVVSQLSEVFDRYEQEGTVSFQLRWRCIWSELKRRA